MDRHVLEHFYVKKKYQGMFENPKKEDKFGRDWSQH